MLLLASGKKVEKVRFLLFMLEELCICCSICRVYENYGSVACMWCVFVLLPWGVVGWREMVKLVSMLIMLLWPYEINEKYEDFVCCECVCVTVSYMREGRSELNFS